MYPVYTPEHIATKFQLKMTGILSPEFFFRTKKKIKKLIYAYT